MNLVRLEEFYKIATEHRAHHECGGVPYANGKLLATLSALAKPDRILELGTGIGYSAACLLYGFGHAQIDTIDQDPVHLSLAEENWNRLEISKSVTTYNDKAEAVLPTLRGPYDLIFADGYDPSMKFLMHFDKLLTKSGLLITANLFLKDKHGGRYLRELRKKRRWRTSVIDDTAISVKLF